LTGPEHYREAERVLAIAARAREANEIDADDDGLPFRTWTLNLAYAQAHATLAAAAASVVDHLVGTQTVDCRAWERVMSR
jgi:hypothetical protein